MSYCYLLHFDRPISPDHTCQHYLGYARDSVMKRAIEHLNGRGARLTQVAKERGIGFRIVRIWRNGTRRLERQLKNGKRGTRLCPICNQHITDFVPYRRKLEAV